MIRLFVALELPDAVRAELCTLCADVPGARWTDPEQMHLTVRFIGEVEEHVFEEVLDALGTVRVDPFDLELRGVGHFPPRGQPRVLWAGLDASPQLQLLRQRVDRALSRVGVPGEGRNFAPHVTLGRLRNAPPRAVATFLTTHGLFHAGPIRIEHFTLFSSQLSPKKAVHRCEAEYAL